LTDEEIVSLGLYAEDLLSQDYFRVLRQQFELQCFAHFMSTAPKDKMEREGVYQQYQGAKDFLAHITACAQQKDQILERIKALSEQDGHIEGID